jgi:UDP-glucose 4-epimerase
MIHPVGPWIARVAYTWIGGKGLGPHTGRTPAEAVQEEFGLQSILVTGGSGFIGAAIVKRLVQEGRQVRVLLRPDSSTRRLAEVLDRVEILHGDFEHLDSVEQSLRARKVDALVHAAWGGVAASQRNSIQQLTGNITGTIKLCEIVANNGCRTFLGMGSQAEYGTVDNILTERTVPHPVTAYGFAKYSAATICEKLCELAQMRFLWLRLLSVYGPSDDEGHMVPHVIRSLVRGEKPHVTKGTQSWDYLYIDDCSAAVSAALQSEAQGTYVLGSGEATTIRTVIEMIRDKIDPGLPVGFGDIPDGASVRNLRADVTHLIEATGWRPKVSLAEGLARTIASIQTEELHPLSGHKAVLHGV